MLSGISLSTVGIGIVLGAISGLIVKFWKSKEGAIEAWLKTLDDKLCELIKAKTGKDVIEPWMHEKWDGWAHEAIVAADKLALSGPFWRNVLRTLIDKNPQRLEQYTKDLTNIDWTKYIIDQLPADIKQVVNDQKAGIAESMVKASKAKFEAVIIGDVKEVVKQAASENKSQKVELHSNEPITPELMAKILAEHKAIVASLSK